MNFVKSFFSMLSNHGVNPRASRLPQGEFNLSTQISLFLLPLALLGLVLSYVKEIYSLSIGFILFAIFLLSVYPLNQYGKSTIAKIGLSVVPQLFVLTAIIILGIGKADNYFEFSYFFIGLTIIPLLLFQKRKDRNLLIITLIFSLAAFLAFDLLLIWSEKSEFVIQPVIDSYLIHIIPQIILWGVIVSGFQLLKMENILNSKKLEATTESLKEYQNIIQGYKDEMAFLHDESRDWKLKYEEPNKKPECINDDLINAKTDLHKNVEILANGGDEKGQKDAYAISMFKTLKEHCLIAHYDLNGKLISINSKVIELLGESRYEFFQDIKPIINHKNNFHNEALDEQYFHHVWEKILSGKSHTINLKFDIEDDIKCLATTFAPLLDSNNKVYEILVLAQDISFLIIQNGGFDKVNEEQREKLSEINQQIELLNFQQMEIFEKNELLVAQKEEIKTINESLELRVKERTSVLEEKNKRLSEYAFINSHVLRSPVSTMMGLINLIKYSSLSEEDKKIHEHLKETAKILDDIVMKINNAIDSGLHFDRVDLEPERSFHPIKKE